MIKSMSFQQFAEVIKHIQKNNAPGTGKRGLPSVKYVDPVFDMRTNSVFALTIRGFGGDQSFHTQNEFRDVQETLYERVMRYLNTPYGEFVDAPTDPDWVAKMFNQ